MTNNSNYSKNNLVWRIFKIPEGSYNETKYVKLLVKIICPSNIIIIFYIMLMLYKSFRENINLRCVGNGKWEKLIFPFFLFPRHYVEKNRLAHLKLIICGKWEIFSFLEKKWLYYSPLLAHFPNENKCLKKN